MAWAASAASSSGVALPSAVKGSRRRDETGALAKCRPAAGPQASWETSSYIGLVITGRLSLNPTVPWIHLPRLPEQHGERRTGLIRAYLRMWRGPRFNPERVENRFSGRIIQ